MVTVTGWGVDLNYIHDILIFVIFEIKNLKAIVIIVSWLCIAELYKLQVCTRQAPTSYKWGYNPYKWPCEGVAGVL